MRGVTGRNRAAAEELRARNIAVLELDVSNDASVDAAFKELRARIGDKLDVLINNAGLFAMGLSETFSPQQVGEMFDVNVIGIQRVTRAALPDMRKNGGADHQHRIDPWPRHHSIHGVVWRHEICCRRGDREL
jgi:NAD(P)-dependent dehydrogenase (short-subunit alcohol dehydrogenase family)